MSARKVFDTKVPEDENIDSGFLSGPLSEHLSEDVDVEDNSDSKKVSSESSEKLVDLDSGLDLCIEERLGNVQLDDTPTAQKEQTPDIPPLPLLFQQDEDGDTQLHIAAVHGCEKSVGTLIRVCPDKAWLDVPNDYGHTSLHLAVMSGHEVVTRMLVRAGASIGVRDITGESPLHAATATGHNECLQALLAPVGGHPHKKLASILNQKNYNGQTCVHLAAAAGNIKLLQTLVYYGADINAREGLAGWTPLHIAARRGHTALVQYLLERCPGVMPYALDYSRRPARKYATNNTDRIFAAVLGDDDESDSDQEFECECRLFELLQETSNPINVA